jgi:electron transfer flavoprotein beta subunit
VKLPEILKAKSKPLQIIALADLGATAAQQFTVVRTEPPPQRSKGVLVKDARELVDVLRGRGLL